MADPANNVLAAASTSRRKRVLPTQPRSEAKRLRTSSQEDNPEFKHTPLTKNSSKVSKSAFQMIYLELRAWGTHIDSEV